MALFGKRKKKKESEHSEIPHQDIKNSVAPQAPPAAPPSGMPEAPEPSTFEPQGTLSPPPSPHSSFEEIKEMAAPSPTDAQANAFDLGDDSLFDIPEVSLSPEDPIQSSNNGPKAATSSQLESSIPEPSGMEVPSQHTLHTSSIHKNQALYITTTQYKKVLSVIDTVKDKVKEASNTHTRLIDIKSEEDIEYENLRRQFQHVEDQLYELDRIIFEK